MEGVATKQLESRISCKKLLCKSESTMNLSFFVSELTWRWKCMFGLSVSSLLAPQFMSRCLYILGSFILQLGIVITVQAEPTRSVEVVSIWILNAFIVLALLWSLYQVMDFVFLQPRPRCQLILQLPLGYHLSNVLCTILFYWSWLV
jgi:hypothetical protein